MVSLVAYQGLRMPEERLGLEVKHVRKNTLLVEQRNIGGEIVRGQKVRGSDPCAIDLLDPVRRRLHDYSNWRRRVWKKARETAGVDPLPPYDLRHAFASLQIRAGMSIPELAEQLGHSPQMTVMTYTHVIRELKGEPRISAEKQIKRARRKARDRKSVV